MKTKLLKFIAFAVVAILVVPNLASAHQPRITKSRLTQVVYPEISKAYYGQLSGEPDVYVIKENDVFDLYVNVLVPDIPQQKKDVSATLLKDGNKIAELDGKNFEWTKFYEPFGADSYWMGPEYKMRVEAGTYEVRVWSTNNDSKYSLAIGQIEVFDGREGINALTIIPELKRSFFNKSPIGFIASPFGWGLIVIVYMFALIVSLTYRAIFRRFTKSPKSTKSIHKSNYKRLLYLVLGVSLLLLAVLTTWSPILIFVSGISIFQVVFWRHR